MKVFVTGGTGLIGQALVRQLNARNDSVTVLTRQIGFSTFPNNVSLVNGLDEVNFNNFDAVINLAGEPIVNKRWTDKQKLRLCRSRWHITQLISEKIDTESSTPIRFISGSAVGYYGRQDGRLIDEQYKLPFQEFSHHLCEQWEQLALATKNANTAVLRTGIVLSDQGGALSKMVLPFKLGLGGKIASGEQYMPWIHIDDMVGAIIFLLEHQTANGPYNLTAPNPVSNLQFTAALAKTLKRPHLFPMPEKMLRVLMGEMADLLVYGQNAIPTKLINAGFNFKYTDLEKALNDLLL